MNNKVYVDEEFKELIPVFISNQKKVVKDVLSSLVDNDFDKIMFFGHRICGTCENYGFLEVGKLGRNLEDAGSIKDKTKVKEICSLIVAYIESVEIIYIEV